MNRDSSDKTALSKSFMLQLDVLGFCVDAVGDYTLPAEPHEWDVCYAVSYPTVLAKLCALKQFSLDLYCIE